MNEGPTLLQRQAVGNMIQHITNNHDSEWGNWLFDALNDWELIPNSQISPYEYYKTLSELPAFPKRIICQLVVMGWNHHHDLQTLHDSITTLIYLKVCGPSEYFFFTKFIILLLILEKYVMMIKKYSSNSTISTSIQYDLQVMAI